MCVCAYTYVHVWTCVSMCVCICMLAPVCHTCGCACLCVPVPPRKEYNIAHLPTVASQRFVSWLEKHLKAETLAAPTPTLLLNDPEGSSTTTTEDKVVDVMWCYTQPYSAPASLSPCCAVLTNSRLILERLSGSADSAGVPGVPLLQPKLVLPLNSIQHVVVGPCYAYLRVEEAFVGKGGLFTLFASDTTVLKRFAEALQDCCTQLDPTNPLDVLDLLCQSDLLTELRDHEKSLGVVSDYLTAALLTSLREGSESRACLLVMSQNTLYCLDTMSVYWPPATFQSAHEGSIQLKVLKELSVLDLTVQSRHINVDKSLKGQSRVDFTPVALLLCVESLDGPQELVFLFSTVTARDLFVDRLTSVKAKLVRSLSPTIREAPEGSCENVDGDDAGLGGSDKETIAVPGSASAGPGVAMPSHSWGQGSVQLTAAADPPAVCGQSGQDGDGQGARDQVRVLAEVHCHVSDAQSGVTTDVQSGIVTEGHGDSVGNLQCGDVADVESGVALGLQSANVAEVGHSNGDKVQNSGLSDNQSVEVLDTPSFAVADSLSDSQSLGTTDPQSSNTSDTQSGNVSDVDSSNVSGNQSDTQSSSAWEDVPQNRPNLQHRGDSDQATRQQWEGAKTDGEQMINTSSVHVGCASDDEDSPGSAGKEGTASQCEGENACEAQPEFIAVQSSGSVHSWREAEGMRCPQPVVQQQCGTPSNVFATTGQESAAGSECVSSDVMADPTEGNCIQEEQPVNKDAHRAEPASEPSPEENDYISSQIERKFVEEGQPITSSVQHADLEIRTNEIAASVQHADLEIQTNEITNSVQHADLEVPASDISGSVQHADLEVPANDITSSVQHADLKVPAIDISSSVQHADLEVPTNDITSSVQHADIEVPTNDITSSVQHADLEVPTNDITGSVQHADLEVPTNDRISSKQQADLQTQREEDAEDTRQVAQPNGSLPGGEPVSCVQQTNGLKDGVVAAPPGVYAAP